MVCAICKVRRPRRFCPGVGGEICTICCGTEREVTVSCPFDCVYLNEARLHERKSAGPAETLPSQDIPISEEMVESNEPLLSTIAAAAVNSAMATPGTVDNDVQEALDCLVKTYRTLQSGIYFESRPANPLAASIYDAVQQAAVQFREEEHRQAGFSHTRDADVLALLAFLQQYEYSMNNGRPRGRAFLHALAFSYPVTARGVPPTAESSIILP